MLHGASRLRPARLRVSWRALQIGSAVLSTLLLGGCGQAAQTSSNSPTLPPWVKQDPSLNPPGRWAASMAGDVSDQNVVLFGGNGGQSIFGDTWTWSAGTWTQQHPVSSPSPRKYASMTYDLSTNDVVLFGGAGPIGPALNDTWAWDGVTWTEQHPLTSPPARERASMAFDSLTGSVLLFGGLGNGVTLDDTWEWNGTSWREITPQTHPTARVDSSLACPTTKAECVLFGGSAAPAKGQPAKDLNDTWSWNGQTWTQDHPAATPPALEHPSIGYDPNSGTTLLFGGLSLTGSLGPTNATWSWNGKTWSLLRPSTSPPGRESASMTFDPTTGHELLFGGENAYQSKTLNDRWSY